MPHREGARRDLTHRDLALEELTKLAPPPAAPSYAQPRPLGRAVVVLLHSPQCTVCTDDKRLLTEIGKRYGKQLDVAAIDAKSYPEVFETYGIERGIPKLALLREGALAGPTLIKPAPGRYLWAWFKGLGYVPDNSA